MYKDILRNVFFVLVFAICIPATAISASTLTTPPNGVSNEINRIPNDGFKKISSGELPGAVVQSLIKDFPTSTLKSAYKNSKSQFKLQMILESGRQMVVYTDILGNWLKL